MKKAVFALIFLLLLLCAGCTIDNSETIQQPPVPVTLEPVIWAIEPQYAFATSFSSGLARTWLEWDAKKTVFIDSSGQVVQEWEADGVYGIKSGELPMAGGLAAVYKGEEKLLLTRAGRVFPFEFPNINTVALIGTYRDTALTAAQDAETEAFGYVNQQGLWYLPPIFVRANSFTETRSTSAAKADTGEQDYIVHADGRMEPWTANVSINAFSEDIACIIEYTYDIAQGKGESRYAFADKHGNRLFEQTVDYVRPFSEGFAAVQEDDLWNLIDTQGNFLTEKPFSSVSDFQNGAAVVLDMQGRTGVIDASGTYILPLKFNLDISARDNKGLHISRKWNKEGLVDSSGKTAVAVAYELVYDEGNYYLLWRTGQAYSMDLYLPIPNVTVKKGYLTVEKIAPNLLAACQSTGKTVDIINVETGIVMRTHCKKLSNGTEGLIPAQEAASEKWGYIDTEGNWVIAPQFVVAETFSEGLAAVMVEGGKMGYIANPLIYDHWEPDSILRGAKLGLYSAEDVTESPVMLEAAFPMIQKMIQVLGGKEVAPQNLREEAAALGLDSIQSLTREDLACLLTLAAGRMEKITQCYLAFLEDESDISSEKLGAVSYTVSMGLMDCVQPGVFDAKTEVTMADWCRGMMRVYEICL